MKFTEFSREIWSFFGATAEKRSEYLRRLYLKAETTGYVDKYLDVGCGVGQNAIVFGQGCQLVHCLDIESQGLIKCQTAFRLKGVNNVSFYQGDAQALPFKDATFDLVSMFSVIEHVPSQISALQEARRILKSGGELILQIPNKYFFVDLHTGLPLLHCLPLSIRHWLLTKLGYKGVGDVMNIHIPSKAELTKLLRDKFAKVQVMKIIYPAELIMPQLRPVYSVFSFLGLFKLVPFGFLFIAGQLEANNGTLDKEH